MKSPVHRYPYLLLMGLFFLGLVSCDYETGEGEHPNHYLLFPNNGETLVQGKTYRIAWTDDRSISMRIRLLKSDTIHLRISENAPNTGEFEWTIPDSLKVGYGYSVRVLSNDDDFSYYESEKSFKILKSSDTASFRDPRDGQLYKIVRLSGRWWMARNFNYDTVGSYCYNNENGNCERHGRLYTINAAKNACPPGWHLPTDNEWKTLEAYLGIPNLEINSTGIRGINAGDLLKDPQGVGFHALYSGSLYTRYYPRYSSINQSAYFWTSTSGSNASRYWIRTLTLTSKGIERSETSAPYYAFSVRYIRDLE